MSIDATADLVHEIQAALDRAQTGVRDPAEMRQAREEMNRLREELRQKIGTVNHPNRSGCRRESARIMKIFDLPARTP